MTALPDKCYSGCHKATGEADDRETLGKEIWRGKCGQRYRLQPEEDGDGSSGQSWKERSGLCDTLGMTSVVRRKITSLLS